MRDPHDVRHGLDDARLVVREHHRHHGRRLVDLGLQKVEIDEAVRARAHRRHREALFGQGARRVHHRVVLDRGIDDAPPRRTGDGGRAAHRHVVGLGAAGREDDLGRIGPDEASHVRARLVERRPGLLAEPVQAGRVAEALAQHRQHRLQHARVQGRGRVVVEVDALHDAILPPTPFFSTIRADASHRRSRHRFREPGPLRRGDEGRDPDRLPRRAARRRRARPPGARHRGGQLCPGRRRRCLPGGHGVPRRGRSRRGHRAARAGRGGARPPVRRSRQRPAHARAGRWSRGAHARHHQCGPLPVPRLPRRSTAATSSVPWPAIWRGA